MASTALCADLYGRLMGYPVIIREVIWLDNNEMVWTGYPVGHYSVQAESLNHIFSMNDVGVLMLPYQDTTPWWSVATVASVYEAAPSIFNNFNNVVQHLRLICPTWIQAYDETEFLREHFISNFLKGRQP